MKGYMIRYFLKELNKNPSRQLLFFIKIKYTLSRWASYIPIGG